MKRIVVRSGLAVVATLLAVKAADLAVGWIDPRGISHFDNNRRFATACLTTNTNNKFLPYPEPIPGSSFDTKPPYRINALGFRGPEIAREKPANTVRVLVLGDSVAFGWGVREEDTIRAQLERALAEWYGPTRRVEVVNLSVPGHNAGHEFERFKERGLPLAPDVVVVFFNENDVEIFPDESAPLTNLAEERFASQSALARIFLNGTSGKITFACVPHLHDLLVHLELYHYQFDEVVSARKLYLDMAKGIAITAKIYGELQDLGAKHGFKLAVFDCSGFPPLAQVTRERAIPYADIALGNELDFEVRNSPTDPHPNAKGHAQLAARAFDALTRTMHVLPEKGP